MEIQIHKLQTVFEMEFHEDCDVGATECANIQCMLPVGVPCSKSVHQSGGIPLTPEMVVLADTIPFVKRLGVLLSLTTPHKSMFVTCAILLKIEKLSLV